MTRPRQTVTFLPCEQLAAHPGNIREDLGDLTDMAASIREHGILQPLVATEHPDQPDVFRLLTGHRRLAGAVLAGLDKVPVIIRHGVDDPAEQVMVMLVENTQRRDLNPVERAQAYGFLRHQGLNQTEIARRSGTTPSTVNYYLNLLELDRASLEDVRDGRLEVLAAVSAVREARQRQRESGGLARRGRPRIRKATAQYGSWFNPDHRLYGAVRAMCTHRAERSVVGNAGCGPCWETAVLEENQAARDQAARDQAARDQAARDQADTVLIDRFLNGNHTDMASLAKQATNMERHLITDAWLDAGGSWNELERITGWKHGRYGRQARRRQEGAA